MPQIERFIVLMYDKASECSTVNGVRKDLFARKGRSLESIPPTSASLLQYVKRSAYHSGYQWGHFLVASPPQPCPDDWGWVKGSLQTWEPCWTLLPSASKICQELLKCDCNPQKGAEDSASVYVQICCVHLSVNVEVIVQLRVKLYVKKGVVVIGTDSSINFLDRKS